MLDLKNCPFCGGKAKISLQGMTYITGPHNQRYYAVIECEPCGVSICGEDSANEDDARPLAIAAWNRRALQAVGPEPAVAVKPLEPIFEKYLEPAGRVSGAYPAYLVTQHIKEMIAEIRSALVATPPAEAVVEALRQIADLEGQAGAGGKAVNIAKDTLAALSTKPAVKDDETVVLPRLTDDIIRAACKAHFGTDNADGVCITVRDRDWTFREAFKRMWSGARAALAAKDGRS